MARFGALGAEAYWDGVRRVLGRRRTVIAVVEHKNAELPGDIVRSDGTLDLYDDVQTRFEITYRRRARRLGIRGGGWVGYLPINDRYTLSVAPRVPIANLERVIARCADIRIDALDSYSRLYEHADEKPQTLYDIVADHFLAAVDRVWRDGLLKVYQRETRRGAMPFGRIDPYETELLRRRTRRPLAAFSAFFRTEDCDPNRLLRRAADRLLRWYEGTETLEGHGRLRVQRLRDTCRRLEAVAPSGTTLELGHVNVEAIVRHLPSRHAEYHLALRLAELIVKDWGVKITGVEGVVALPVVLVDMAAVFESYARRILEGEATERGGVEVKNGNVAAPGGAKTTLFHEFEIDSTNPSATPDIVVGDKRGTIAVIDVKYKPARVVPERADINQVMTYAVRYECDKAMVLYPDIPEGGRSVVAIGRIGGICVYRGGMDLGAKDIASEEQRSASAILEALKRDLPDDNPSLSVALA